MTVEPPGIPDAAVPISETEMLRRQIHPLRFDAEGKPMRVAFAPNTDDQSLLSTLREHVDPEVAHQRYVKKADGGDSGRESAGTWGISTDWVSDADLRCFDDSATVEDDHASVDFRTKTSRGQIKQASRKLWEPSAENGPLYEAPKPN